MSTSEEPGQEAVGQAEACDWCGRPGRVRQHDFYEDGRLVCRNPALCEVCFTIWDAPAEVIDAFAETGVDFVGIVEAQMEAEFAVRWREKVGSGARLPAQ